MTREEATRKVRMTPEYHYDGVYSHTETNIYDIIDQIFNDHEAQLKQRDDEIERLKAELMEANEVIDAYAEVQCQMTP